jgi:hypothetical protein
MKLSMLAGATSQSINVFIQNSTSTSGGGLTGLVYNTTNLTAYYTFTGAIATSTVITLVTLAAVNSAWSSGGFKEIDSTGMPGWYRLDLPNAILAIGKGRCVSLHLRGAANMAECPIEIELTGWDNQLVPGQAGAMQIVGANVAATSYTAGLTISNAAGDALALTSSGANGNGINASGNGTGAGLLATGGATGNGIKGIGGATSGAGINGTAPTSGDGIHAVGGGALHGCNLVGGATGNGLNIVGGSTSGLGISVTTTAGDGISSTPTAGNALTLSANGTSKHGASITGGTAGTSDGLHCAAGTGGVDVRGNLTGNLSGSVGSISGVTFPTNFGALSIDANGNVRILGAVKKNTALADFTFFMALSSDHYSPATGKTVTATRCLDGAGFVSCANSVVEIANGFYQINLASTDLNGNNVALSFSASGCDNTLISIITQP